MDIDEAKSAMAETGEELEIVLKAEMVELLSDFDGHELTVECTDPGDQVSSPKASAKTSSTRTTKISTSPRMRYPPSRSSRTETEIRLGRTQSREPPS